MSDQPSQRYAGLKVSEVTPAQLQDPLGVIYLQSGSAVKQTEKLRALVDVKKAYATYAGLPIPSKGEILLSADVTGVDEKAYIIPTGNQVLLVSSVGCTRSGGSGTATVTLSLYDGTSSLPVGDAISATGTTAPFKFDLIGTPLYIDSGCYLELTATAGFTSGEQVSMMAAVQYVSQ